jgi:hypothetical protein
LVQTKLSGVRAVTADAMRDLARQNRRRDDPPPLQPRGENRDVKAGKWTPDINGMPREDPCPVRMLGVEGALFHLIDSNDQFRSFKAADFSHSGIQDLFAACPNYPEWAWPRTQRGKKIVEDGEEELEEDGARKPRPPPKIESFKDDDVRKSLFRWASRMGLFSPNDRLRGRGAWRMRGGQLLYHAGEDLWTVEGSRMKVLSTGLYEGLLYPRMASIPAPWSEPFEPHENPAGAILKAFRTWTWDRPDVDPVLLLGWLGVALGGGALDWRSAIFLIGDRETGKSTLQHLLKDLLGEALVSTAETTKAGIYQLMKHDTRAVAVDEIEAKADNRKQIDVIELARVASSGGLGLRGGAEGVGTEFTVRCAFLFSAINPPPLEAQDLSRMAVLRLGPLQKERAAEAPPAINADTDGRMLLFRLMAEWKRWPATYEAYRAALAAGGHSGRGQDTYGTLLAMADMLLGPELAAELGVPMVDDEIAQWSVLMSAAAVPEISDALPNWRRCLEHLLSSRVPAWKDGQRATVGQLLADLERMPNFEIDLAERMLAQAGLSLIRRGEMLKRPQGPGDTSGQWGAFYGIGVPNKSSRVAELFQGTIWQGSGSAGGWVEALRQGVPSGAVITDKDVNRRTIDGYRQRCTLIDVRKFQEIADPEAER